MNEREAESYLRDLVGRECPDLAEELRHADSQRVIEALSARVELIAELKAGTGHPFVRPRSLPTQQIRRRQVEDAWTPSAIGLRLALAAIGIASKAVLSEGTGRSLIARAQDGAQAGIAPLVSEWANVVIGASSARTLVAASGVDARRETIELLTALSDRGVRRLQRSADDLDTLDARLDLVSCLRTVAEACHQLGQDAFDALGVIAMAIEGSARAAALGDSAQWVEEANAGILAEQFAGWRHAGSPDATRLSPFGEVVLTRRRRRPMPRESRRRHVIPMPGDRNKIVVAGER